jgi:hypothetical protein
LRHEIIGKNSSLNPIAENAYLSDCGKFDVIFRYI